MACGRRDPVDSDPRLQLICLCINELLRTKLQLPADGGLGETRKRLAKTPLKLRQNLLTVSVDVVLLPAADQQARGETYFSPQPSYGEEGGLFCGTFSRGRLASAFAQFRRDEPTSG